MSGVQQTSLDAFERIKPSLGERQRQVLRVFLLNRRKSYTNHELARELKLEINTVVPRVYELREKGLLVLAGKRPCSITHHDCLAWMLRIDQP